MPMAATVQNVSGRQAVLRRCFEREADYADVGRQAMVLGSCPTVPAPLSLAAGALTMCQEWAPLDAPNQLSGWPGTYHYQALARHYHPLYATMQPVYTYLNRTWEMGWQSTDGVTWTLIAAGLPASTVPCCAVARQAVLGDVIMITDGVAIYSRPIADPAVAWTVNATIAPTSYPVTLYCDTAGNGDTYCLAASGVGGVSRELYVRADGHAAADAWGLAGTWTPGAAPSLTAPPRIVNYDFGGAYKFAIKDGDELWKCPAVGAAVLIAGLPKLLDLGPYDNGVYTDLYLLTRYSGSIGLATSVVRGATPSGGSTIDTSTTRAYRFAVDASRGTTERHHLFLNDWLVVPPATTPVPLAYFENHTGAWKAGPLATSLMSWTLGAIPLGNNVFSQLIWDSETVADGAYGPFMITHRPNIYR